MFLTAKAQQILEQLGINPNDAIIVGSGVLAAYGIRDANDIDLMVRRTTFDNLAQSGHTVGYYNDGTRKISDSNFEIMYSWLGATYDDILPHTVVIDELTFISLPFLRSMKQKQGRAKDQDDIERIDKYTSSL